jgi:hypothetical protein
MASENLPRDVPDTEARSERDLWLEAVLNMIELTQNGEIQWRIGRELLQGYGDPTTPPYYAHYKSQTYRLEKRWIPASPPTPAEQILRSFQTTLRGSRKRPSGHYVVSLDVVDTHGLSLFAFPYVNPLWDLLTVVQKQTAADKALHDLLGARTNSEVPATEAAGFPIERYDELNVEEISGRLNELSAEDLRRVRDYEAHNKSRGTLIERLDRKIRAS